MKIITLDDYISSLSNYFKKDTEENDAQKRLNKLNAYYGNEYLNKVYEDTLSVFKDALFITKNYYPGYWIIPILSDQTSYITILEDKSPSDAIYVTDDGRLVSDRLFKKLLGSKFSMCISYDYEAEHKDECKSYITFTGPVEYLNILRENYSHHR